MGPIAVLLLDDHSTLLAALAQVLKELSAGAVRAVGTVLASREVEARASGPASPGPGSSR